MTCTPSRSCLADGWSSGRWPGSPCTAGLCGVTNGATLGYDYLILATGVAAAYHGIPGEAEHSLGLYTRHDAIVLRDRIMTGLERISQTGLSSDVAVAVVGGGATGVELPAASPTCAT